MPRSNIEDDSDDSIAAADAAAVAKVKAQVTEAKSTEPQDEPGVQVLRVEERSADDDDEEGEGEKQSRTERRRNRFREAQERAAQLEEENQRLRSYADNLARERQQSQQVDQGPSEVDQKINGLRREKELLYQEFVAKGQNLTPQELENYKRRNDQLEDALYDARFEKRQAVEGPKLQAEAVRAAQAADFRRRYGDIYSHPESARALQYAEGQFKARLAANPRVDQAKLLDEVMDESRRTILRTGRPAPSPAQQRRYSGEGAGPAVSQRSDGAVDVPMTKGFRKLATALYPNLPEAEAYKKWAAGPGKATILGAGKRSA